MQKYIKYPTLYRVPFQAAVGASLPAVALSPVAVPSFLAVAESLSSAVASLSSAVALSPAAAGLFLPAVVPAPCPRPLPLSSGNPVAPFRNASFPFRPAENSVCAVGSVA